MKLDFIPVDYSSFDWEGKNYVKLIGRTKKGKRVCVIDFYEPNFWAILKEGVSKKKTDNLIKKIEKVEVEGASRKTKVLKTELHNKKFLGKDVKAIRIFVTNHKDMHAVADELGFDEIFKRREYDLPLISKYIMEKNVQPLNWYEVEGEVLNNSLEFGGLDNALDVDICIKAEKIRGTKQEIFEPRILAFDIETNEFEIGKGDILMISLYGENFKKVLTWKKCSAKQDFVECFKDEAEMLEKFVGYVKDYSPDLLVGYFSDGFDLPYLKAGAEKNKVKLSLGLDGKQPIFSRGRMVSGKISGIVHVDLFRFIQTAYSQYLQSETLRLNDVASELIGETKYDFDFAKLGKMKQKDWVDFFEYNLHDSAITFKLAQKIWPDLVEFSKIMQTPLFDVSRDSMSRHVENYILHNLKKFNEIAEKRPVHEEIGKRREMGKYEGAFVFQPEPGLYENIAMFDFTSMYASVIVSYNLSLSTLKEIKEGGNSKFSEKAGFFPEMLGEIIKKRKKYKEEYNQNKNPLTKARSNAYKLLANASYGYQGFFGARYYCREAAAATAALARKNILSVIEKIKKKGYKIIYSDSVSGKSKVLIKEGKEIFEVEIEDLFKKINQTSLSGKEYNFKDNLEVLTLDKNGKSVFMPVVYVMRHKCDKKMYRVNFTNNWNIDVTEDHSLMGYQSCHFNQTNKAKSDVLRRIIEIKPTEIGSRAKSIVALKKIPMEDIQTRNYPKEVYEFMGYFIGDGSFMRNKQHKKDNKDYYLRLSLGNDSEEIKKKLIYPLIKKKYIKTVWESKTRKGDLTLNGLKLVRIISENLTDKNRKKTIPGWLFYEKEENIQSFLRGLFSADGCVMIRNNAPIIKYTSIDDDYIKEVRKLLYRCGISHSIFKENSINKYKTENRTYSSGSYSKNILIKDREEFAKRIGFFLERKNKRAKIETNNLKYKLIKNFEFGLQSVKNIKETSLPKYVYDLEVEDTHCFFADYVLVHNTDSIAFLLGEKTKKQTLEFLKKINSGLPGIMELDLEDFYKRGLFVSKRTTNVGARRSAHPKLRSEGAKKKYALINHDDKLKIRGFETVRRDWCNLARGLQNEVIVKILKEGDEKSALKVVKKVVNKIKNREIDKKQLIIRTQLKKPINEYVSQGPHVIAAKKMEEQGIPVSQGMLIEYYIAETKQKKKLVRDKVKLPDEEGEYNKEYYLNNQILPAVENIFEVFGVDLKEVIDGERQKKLF